jgi:hypothetical protein
VIARDRGIGNQFTAKGAKGAKGIEEKVKGARGSCQAPGQYMNCCPVADHPINRSRAITRSPDLPQARFSGTITGSCGASGWPAFAGMGTSRASLR